jgi:hypothetical protein
MYVTCFAISGYASTQYRTGRKVRKTIVVWDERVCVQSAYGLPLYSLSTRWCVKHMNVSVQTRDSDLLQRKSNTILQSLR